MRLGFSDGTERDVNLEPYLHGPIFAPIRTDEQDVSQHRVFLGGINVFLQQKSRLFRWTPWFVDRLLDVPRLLRSVRC